MNITYNAPNQTESTVAYFPELYGLDSKGGVKVWEVLAEKGEGNTGVIVTAYGKLGGKMQESRKTALPKNVGRASETTGFEQAISEAESLWKKKKDKQYRESIEELEDTPLVPLPMLAHPFGD